MNKFYIPGIYKSNKNYKDKIWENSQAWDRRNPKTPSPRQHWPQERPQRKNGPKERKRKREIITSSSTTSSSKISSKRPLKWDSSLQPFWQTDSRLFCQLPNKPSSTLLLRRKSELWTNKPNSFHCLQDARPSQSKRLLKPLLKYKIY